MIFAFLKGLGIGASLIIAIGAQNAFVLRQGLLRHHVFTSALICTLCDMALIYAGVAGMGTLISAAPNLLIFAKWGGAAFLFAYGARSAWAAFHSGGLTSKEEAPRSHMAIVVSAFSFSLLNPHVYLDTVVLLGTVGGQQVGIARNLFAAGAMTASTIWFFGLAYGARLLAPLFAQPIAWRILDGLIAIVMWLIAVSLLCS
ncbi:LysE/ArgO family amino acid transporter [Solimicrobium silvestre]|uniref:Lysine efflux permease n=1 Tax=Solimicrobium silvestre TaxID=2099400 RepID=A0A2S9H3L7_9BURK|nr:LysE/ArgO family amino acid transporter [Solimicrobium silvestre]PRC94575.1 Lysine efflux permease [Solimicrobium silvestre]